jgi:hypothetical protein
MPPGRKAAGEEVSGHSASRPGSASVVSSEAYQEVRPMGVMAVVHVTVRLILSLAAAGPRRQP